jgi:hypothetical protein
LGSLGELDDDGYSADHYIIKSPKNENIKCEIQVRTLTQDLWAVFTHYEAYKREETNDSKKEELKNYARLMDVSDHYAQSIRKRKIQEADQFHKNKAGIHHSQDIIDYTFLINKFYGKSYEHNELNDCNSDRVDVFKLCDLLKNLSTYNIFTTHDLEIVLSNRKYCDYIRTSVKEEMSNNKEYEDEAMHDIDEFDILCRCFSDTKHKKDFEKQNLTDGVKKHIKLWVNIWRDELITKKMLQDVYKDFNNSANEHTAVQ